MAEKKGTAAIESLIRKADEYHKLAKDLFMEEDHVGYMIYSGKAEVLLHAIIVIKEAME